MCSQVQVSMPIHGNTIECAVKINFVITILACKQDSFKNFLRLIMHNNAQTTELVLV